MWWATVFAVVIGAALTLVAVTGVIPYEGIWVVLIVWPLCVLAALVAYRALGHKINENYVIMRSGLTNQATTVAERSAVSTIVIRESELQRWLKLRTVYAMTAAGAKQTLGQVNLSPVLASAPPVVEQTLCHDLEGKVEPDRSP